METRAILALFCSLPLLFSVRCCLQIVFVIPLDNAVPPIDACATGLASREVAISEEVCNYWDTAAQAVSGENSVIGQTMVHAPRADL